MSPTPPYNHLLLKGALIAIDRQIPLLSKIIIFQYNPATLSRTLTPGAYQSVSSQRLVGPPKQDISCKVQLESTTSMNRGGASTGVYGALSTLELLLYPSSISLLKYKLQIGGTGLYAVPPEAPRVLFFWGPQRMLPVIVKSIKVEEIIYNNYLFPVRADVDLTLEVQPIQDAEDSDFAVLIANLALMETASAVWMAESLLGSASSLVGI